MTLFTAFGQFAGQAVAAPAAAPGMVLLTPTSIAHSGTSATLGANGQVTFSAVTSLSLNGVFTADFDNYVVSIRCYLTSANEYLRARFRASGSDATGSNYTDQLLQAISTTVSGERATSQGSQRIGAVADAQRGGLNINIYGPFLAQPTATRSTTIYAFDSATLTDFAATHSLSTSYDGITIFPNASSITGAVQVYGVRS